MVKNIIKKITPRFILDFYYYIWALAGAIVYGFPSRKLIVIGVTGTNGKSTVTDLTSRILIEAGFKTASLSSIRFKINDQERQNKLKMTMPGRFSIQKFLRQAKNAGCKYVVLETTSEGIKQHRHRFIDYDVAAMTNVRPEHIESHGSFEKYRNAKGRLFATLSQSRRKFDDKNRAIKKTSIVNLDDDGRDYFLRFKADQKWGYCLAKIENNLPVDKIILAQDIRILPQGTQFSVDGMFFNLKLLGEFNISNALTAISIGLSQNIDLAIIKNALEKTNSVPGRIEEIINVPFKIFVDYAHTPDAFEAIHKTVAALNPSSVIWVFGSCGGGRDKWKRPLMGKIAAKNSDRIILANEDPYDEDPETILDEIEIGIKEAISDGSKVILERILDRRQAIRRAMELAKPTDVVLITGKGSEPWMCMPNGKKMAWDDREIVREEFQKLKKQK